MVPVLFRAVALWGVLSVVMAGCGGGHTTGAGVLGQAGSGSSVTKCDKPARAQPSGSPAPHR